MVDPIGGVVLIDHQAGAVDPHALRGRDSPADDVVVRAARGGVERTHVRHRVAGGLRRHVVMQRRGRGLDLVLRAVHHHRDAGLIDRQAEHGLVVADDGRIHRVLLGFEAQRLVLGDGRERCPHVHRLHDVPLQLQNVCVACQKLFGGLLRRCGPCSALACRGLRRVAILDKVEVPGMTLFVVENVGVGHATLLSLQGNCCGKGAIKPPGHCCAGRGRDEMDR